MDRYNIFDWWPIAASPHAQEVDHLVIAFTGVMVLLVGPIVLLLPYWLWKYQQGRKVDRRHREDRNTMMEMSWTLIPFFAALIFYAWAGIIYNRDFHPPPNAMVIQAVGKRWMWKFEHPGGQREINDLHVPVDETVRIDLASADVVHGLYIPALRAQMEVIPGRRTFLWFHATRVGVYDLDCSEYCGVNHSDMRGKLYVMTRPAFTHWLHEMKTPNVVTAGGPYAHSSTEPAQ